MIVEYVRYQIPAQRREAFEEAYGQAQAALAVSPHCLAWELSRCAQDPTQYTLRIERDSVEGHLQGFRKGPDFGLFFATIRAYVDDIAEMRHYEVTEVRGRNEAVHA